MFLFFGLGFLGWVGWVFFVFCGECWGGVVVFGDCGRVWVLKGWGVVCGVERFGFLLFWVVGFFCWC